ISSLSHRKWKRAAKSLFSAPASLWEQTYLPSFPNPASLYVLESITPKALPMEENIVTDCF
ncbi:MAG: hypothetical protein ABSH17_05365, partial [Syntrophobacteraceae bacterium]